MRILSHRGYWKHKNEKNTEAAFRRSFSLGYGTETDVRDCKGELVISHDMPNGVEVSCESLLEIAAKNQTSYRVPLTLALNIKADGLAKSLNKLLLNYPGLDYFVFDMAIPDMPSYFEVGIPVFSRMSEVEKDPAWLDLASGVWLDSFGEEWHDNSLIESLISKGKRVCIVSPELHKRPHLYLWQRIKMLATEEKLMLCTDFPDEARQFFFLGQQGCQI